MPEGLLFNPEMTGYSCFNPTHCRAHIRIETSSKIDLAEFTHLKLFIVTVLEEDDIRSLNSNPPLILDQALQEVFYPRGSLTALKDVLLLQHSQD